MLRCLAVADVKQQTVCVCETGDALAAHATRSSTAVTMILSADMKQRLAARRWLFDKLRMYYGNQRVTPFTVSHRPQTSADCMQAAVYVSQPHPSVASRFFSDTSWSNSSARHSMHWTAFLDRHHAMKEFVRRREKGEALSSIGISLRDVIMSPAISLEAAQPIDAVFGLYGVCKALGFEMAASDYTKPIAIVVTESARAIIESGRSLRLLESVVGAAGSDLGIPSWVPNFSGSIHTWSLTNPPHLSLSVRSQKMVSGNSRSEFAFEADGWALKVKGRRVDTVQAVGQTWKVDNTANILGGSATNTGQMAASLVDCIGSWYDLVYECSHSLVRDTVIQTLAKVLTDDWPGPLDPLETISRYLSLLVDRSKMGQNPQRMYLAHSDDGLAEVRQWGEILISSAIQRIMSQLLDAHWKAAFRTSGNLLGVGNYSVRSGDMVVIFHGMERPCIVRPCQGGYEFVGEAYVNRIMGGEFWSSRSDSDDERFILV
ncbi:hypothetical protein P154DRAFT_530979 [Amniculicola lignicola CBS 123094]|uniref:Heterokaryon incompatibility domain-containing protein n=1 Tax=Amniculicola lignicola CBS 123094 TaxID=1392246 RepID=A0A6A5WYV3_9PLEO|nr:hypothetical protein P154DRAFT_530979 [Amniculicola lignicola CBS 123094]